MTSARKEKIYRLLKGIETGDPESVKVVHEQKYIQHNPQTREGGEGLAQLFARLSKTNPSVEIVRLFEDGDFVFGHTIYNFASERVGFEVFRYEGDQVVEHWDNIQVRNGEMVGGTTQSSHLELTETNRAYVRQFVSEVFVRGQHDRLLHFIHPDSFVEHSTLCPLTDKLKAASYQTTHRILAEGDFVLCVHEGFFGDAHSSFYDLFRVEGEKIVEHWDTLENVPPRSEWKNSNGKF